MRDLVHDLSDVALEVDTTPYPRRIPKISFTTTDIRIRAAFVRMRPNISLVDDNGDVALTDFSIKTTLKAAA